MAPWLCFNSTVELQCVIITAISTGHKHSITFVHLHVIFQHQKMPVTVDTLTPTCYCLHPHVASENLTRHLGWKQQNHIVAYETTRTKQIQYTGTLTLKKKKSIQFCQLAIIEVCLITPQSLWQRFPTVFCILNC